MHVECTYSPSCVEIIRCALHQRRHIILATSDKHFASKVTVDRCQNLLVVRRFGLLIDLINSGDIFWCMEWWIWRSPPRLIPYSVLHRAIIESELHMWHPPSNRYILLSINFCTKLIWVKIVVSDYPVLLSRPDVNLQRCRRWPLSLRLRKHERWKIFNIFEIHTD